MLIGLITLDSPGLSSLTGPIALTAPIALTDPIALTNSIILSYPIAFFFLSGLGLLFLHVFVITLPYLPIIRLRVLLRIVVKLVLLLEAGDMIDWSLLDLSYQPLLYTLAFLLTITYLPIYLPSCQLPMLVVV